MTSRTSYGWLTSTGTTPYSSAGSTAGGDATATTSHAGASGRRQGRDDVADDLERVLVVLGEVVDDARAAWRAARRRRAPRR